MPNLHFLYLQKNRCFYYSILFTTALAALVLGTYAVGDFRIDDAYISFSYAKNLALGRGLIYSYSIDVEGYSNFLWVLILSLAQAAHPNMDLIYPARFISYASLLVIAWSIQLQLFRFKNWLVAFSGVMLFLLWTDVIYAAQSGLESVFYTSVISIAILAFGHRRYTLGWYLCLIASLTRIDGFILFGFAFILRLVQSSDSIRLRRLIRECGVPITLFLCYFLLRWEHYGLAFPLPYYTKHHFSGSSFLDGLEYLENFVVQNGLFYLLPFLILAYLFRTRQHILAHLLFVPFYIVYILAAGSDWMAFNRLLLPLVPSIIIISLTGFLTAHQLVSTHFSKKLLPLITTVSTLVVVVVGLHSNSYFINSAAEMSKLRALNAEARHVQNLLVASKYFRTAMEYSGEKLVTDYGGVFAYFTDAYVIEMWGLCNREIAILGHTRGINKIYGKTCHWCYKYLKPDYFHLYAPLVGSPNKVNTMEEAIHQVWQSNSLNRFLNFRENYRLVKVLSIDQKQAMFLLERKRQGVNTASVTRSGFSKIYLTQ